MPAEDSQTAPAKNDPREVFGWIVYDWANSAFYTTVVAALFGDYATRLAQAAVGENGTIFSFGPLLITAKLLALNLVFVFTASRFGISTGMAVRLSLLSAGVWWGGFSVITFTRLRTRPA